MAASRGIRRRRPAREWRALVAEWVTSGEAAADFSTRKGVTAHNFARWRRRFGVRTASPPGSKSTAISARPPAFSEVHAPTPSPRAAGDRVEVILRGGRRVRVWPGFDADTVARLVAVLEKAC